MSSPSADNGAQSYPSALIAINAVLASAIARGVVWLVNGYNLF